MRADGPKRLSYANVMSTLAVFLVLGGGVAVAAKAVVDNSKDVASQSIKNSDVKRESLKSNRLKNGAAVGDRDVVPNSLTGKAIDESSLDLSFPADGAAGPAGGVLTGSYPNPALAPGVVGEAQEADRQRRIVLPPAAFIEGVGGPVIIQSGGVQSWFFSPAVDANIGATLEVPLDRAAGSDLEVRLLWDANGIGIATWNVGFRTLAPGANPSAGIPDGNDVPANSPANNTLVETVVAQIPAAGLQNGDILALAVERNADAASDTLVVQSQIRLVEIRYTATG